MSYVSLPCFILYSINCILEVVNKNLLTQISKESNPVEERSKIELNVLSLKLTAMNRAVKKISLRKVFLSKCLGYLVKKRHAMCPLDQYCTKQAQMPHCHLIDIVLCISLHYLQIYFSKLMIFFFFKQIIEPR